MFLKLSSVVRTDHVSVQIRVSGPQLRKLRKLYTTSCFGKHIIYGSRSSSNHFRGICRLIASRTSGHPLHWGATKFIYASSWKFYCLIGFVFLLLCCSYRSEVQLYCGVHVLNMSTGQNHGVADPEKKLISKYVFLHRNVRPTENSSSNFSRGRSCRQFSCVLRLCVCTSSVQSEPLTRSQTRRYCSNSDSATLGSPLSYSYIPVCRI